VQTLPLPRVNNLYTVCIYYSVRYSVLTILVVTNKRDKRKIVPLKIQIINRFIFKVIKDYSFISVLDNSREPYSYSSTYSIIPIRDQNALKM
jgi:hypothetical protein